MRLRDHPGIKSHYDAVRIDPRELKITPGYNARDFGAKLAQEELAILKEQIREEGGVRVPLEVRMVGDEIHVVSGHRRHRAVMELIDEGVEIASVPAVVEERTTNDAERTLRLIIHNSGLPLTSLEKAEVIRRLINMGWTREKICNRLGYKTPQTIANFELLLAAPERVREAVRQGDIAPSTAIELVRQHGEGAAEKLPEIKQTAGKRGKTRASVRDVRRPAGNASPLAVENRNLERIAEANKAAKAQQNTMSRLEQAIAALIDIEKRGITPKEMAMGFGTRGSSEIEPAVEWLYEFCDALRLRDAA